MLIPSVLALCVASAHSPPVNEAAPADAAEAVALRYQWREGELLSYQMTQVNWSEPPGREAGAMRTTVLTRLDVGRVHPDGSADVALTVESMTMVLEPGQDEVAAPLPGLADITIPMTVTPEGEFRPAPPHRRQVGGLGDRAAEHPRDDAAPGGEDPILKAFLVGFPVLPGEPVRPGEPWTIEETAYLIRHAVFLRATGESVLIAAPGADEPTARIEAELRGEGGGVSGPGPMTAAGERVAQIDHRRGRLLNAASDWTLTIPAEQTPAREEQQLRYKIVLELLE